MKLLLSIALVASLAQAESFETFLDTALQTSPYLESNRLNIEQSNVQARLTQRYKNPSLELELSNFSTDADGNKGGYRAGLSQPLRLWGIGDDRKTLATAQKAEAQSFVKLNRANFVLSTSRAYSRYKYALAREALREEELEISQTILDISRARFDNGTIARVKFMQAEVDVHRGENRLNRAKVERLSSYYQLLATAGVTETPSIDDGYEFKLALGEDATDAASLLYVKSKRASAAAKAKLNANRLEWVNLYGEFEKEPDQKIARVGVSIPLILFNAKKEEKKIAQLEAKKRELQAKNMDNSLRMRLKKIETSIEALKRLEQSTAKLLQSQEKLLAMYRDGYKIANINLVELQSIKNQMIQTKADSLEIRYSKEQNIIQYNFLVGEYNE